MGGQGTPWPRVIAVGDALMDTQYWVERIPTPGEDVQILAREENTGGSAANSAMGLAWLGVSCSFCGCIGQDRDGRRIESLLAKTGVDVRLVRRMGSTGYVLSMIDRTGERTMFSYRGASVLSAMTPDLEEAICHAEAVLLSGYMLANRQQASFALQVAETAQRAGAKVALDASPTFGGLSEDMKAKVLRRCDIFLPNRDELAGAGPGTWEENLEELAQTVPCVAVKLGGNGALLRAKPGLVGPQSPALSLETSTRRVQPLDTTGAGDAFNAGFLAAYLRGLAPRQWLQAGNRLAGRVISTRGASGLYKNEPPSTGYFDEI